VLIFQSLILMTAWDDDAQLFVLTPMHSLLDLWIFGLEPFATSLSEQFSQFLQSSFFTPFWSALVVSTL